MRNKKRLSIVIITWNSAGKLDECLSYISKQNYPTNSMEIVFVDGGSSDYTFQIIEKYRRKIPCFRIIKTKIKDQEPKRAIGIQNARGKYICSIDPDVFLTDKNWLKNMIEPLESDTRLAGSQTLHYSYEKKTTILNRYFGLFGFNDPVAFYLHKADRIPHYENKWIFNNQFKDMGNYFEVEFNRTIPTMGCNGVIFRASTYKQYAKDENSFFHIDVVQDMVRQGFDKYAIVKNSVFHSTASNFAETIIKRIRYMNLHYETRKNERRYLVFDTTSSVDKISLILFVFYTITFIQPIFLSIKGYRKVKDIAWFLHPFMCWIFLVGYGISIFTKNIKSIFASK
ncbi:MAG: glycosyltransferase family 2 protein [Candidatus Roizmanbacteria bacterium]|nr:glycosyltransferase family 2 protein [Candidatus Roizmanbacteria bacterium]